MKDKKKLPKGLAEKQELQRQETINKVLRAFVDIQNEGGKVTITTLMEYTGLARSTFAKEHIREMLVDYGYTSRNVDSVVASCKKAKHAEIIAEKERLISELRAKNAALEKECELLRGRLFLAMQ